VLVVVCLVVIGIYVQKKPGTVTDITEQDKAELEAAYKDFRSALESGKVKREDLDRVRYTVKLGREVPRSEVVDLTRVFREAAGNAGGSDTAPVPTLAPMETTPVP
jgi:hypothetical protein